MAVVAYRQRAQGECRRSHSDGFSHRDGGAGVEVVGSAVDGRDAVVADRQGDIAENRRAGAVERGRAKQRRAGHECDGPIWRASIGGDCRRESHPLAVAGRWA